MTQRHVLIVGPGRAGSALAAALSQVNWRVSIAGRHGQTLPSLPDGCEPAADRLEHVDCMILTVPDPAVASAASTWAPRLSATAAVLHVSGAHGITLLPEALGERRGVAHPLMSLGGSADAHRLRGAFFAIGGSGPGRRAAVEVASAVGGLAHDVPEDARAAYHAAAVLASNGVYALLHAAFDVAATAGIEDDALRAGLATLLESSARRARQAAPVQSATGPVVRGDATTLQRHLEALPSGPESTELYRSVQRVLVDLAEARGVPAPLLAAMRAVLYESETP